jgi:hypothetical protein
VHDSLGSVISAQRSVISEQRSVIDAWMAGKQAGMCGWLGAGRAD